MTLIGVLPESLSNIGKNLNKFKILNLAIFGNSGNFVLKIFTKC